METNEPQTPAPTRDTKPETRRVTVSAAVAAELYRRRCEHSAAVAAANAAISAVRSAGMSAVAIADAAMSAAERMALTAAGIEEGSIVRTEGLGDETVMIVALPRKEDPPEPSP